MTTGIPSLYLGDPFVEQLLNDRASFFLNLAFEEPDIECGAQLRENPLEIGQRPITGRFPERNEFRICALPALEGRFDVVLPGLRRNPPVDVRTELFPAGEALLGGGGWLRQTFDRYEWFRIHDGVAEEVADDRPELGDHILLAQHLGLDLLVMRELAQEIRDVLAFGILAPEIFEQAVDRRHETRGRLVETSTRKSITCFR